jgi:hypothetical protein
MGDHAMSSPRAPRTRRYSSSASSEAPGRPPVAQPRPAEALGRYGSLRLHRPERPHHPQESRAPRRCHSSLRTPTQGGVRAFPAMQVRRQRLRKHHRQTGVCRLRPQPFLDRATPKPPPSPGQRCNAWVSSLAEGRAERCGGLAPRCRFQDRWAARMLLRWSTPPRMRGTRWSPSRGSPGLDG